MRSSLLSLSLIMLCYAGVAYSHAQTVDLNFNTKVSHPAYKRDHPRVLFDESHNNADTFYGRFRPFTELIMNDGYEVASGAQILSKKALRRYAVLIIVNALGPREHNEASAFTNDECDTVREWVRSGGSLLLITDHAPFSAAMGELSKRFGVELTAGYTIDKVHYNKDSDDQTELIFTREDGLIGNHPITNGRDSSERINRIITFSGTSIRGPNDSVAFLRLSNTAMDVVPPEAKPRKADEPAPDYKPVSAVGRAQGIAFEFGKGRVVVFGEAAMLSAQTTKQGMRFGMNVPGIDNRQLALNVMHWLSKLLK